MVCASDAPADQKLEAALNSPDSALLVKPPFAERSSVGKNAARSTPISALAAATWRSAEAMSGRRSTSAEGRVTGTDGTVGRHSAPIDGTVKAAGFSPTSTAIASSYWVRTRVSPSRSDCAEASCDSPW